MDFKLIKKLSNKFHNVSLGTEIRVMTDDCAQWSNGRAYFIINKLSRSIVYSKMYDNLLKNAQQYQ